ncbi:MAG: cell envelope integrity protein TolA [Pseudomonadota bacterium]
MPSAYDRSDFSPPQDAGAVRAFGLALLVHALLIAALTWGINWQKTDQSSGFEAEIWSAVSQPPAPRQVETPPPAPEPPAPTPQPTPEVAVKAPEVKAPAPEPDVDIALEQEKQRKLLLERQKAADAKKASEKQQAQAQVQVKKEKELKAREEDAQRLAADQARKAEAQKLAKLQDRMLTGVSGASGNNGVTGSAQRPAGAGASSSYKGRVQAAIRPNIVFSDEIVGSPMATIEVRVTSDGTVISQRLTQSSGNKNWDEAAINAIVRTRVMPRDIDGRIPELIMIIEMRPRG